jgi:hypothetical protein
MTRVVGRAHGANGPHFGKAAVALVVAAGCLYLLIVLLTPNPASPTGATAAGLPGALHGAESSAPIRPKLIPIAFGDG